MNLILFLLVFLHYSLIFSMQPETDSNLKNLLEEGEKWLEQNSVTAVFNWLYKTRQANPKAFRLTQEGFNSLNDTISRFPEFSPEALESLKVSSNKIEKETILKLLRKKLVLTNVRQLALISFLDDEASPGPGVSLRLSSHGLPLLKNSSSGNLQPGN